MRILFLALLALVACESSTSSTASQALSPTGSPTPPGDAYSILIDLSACRAPDGVPGPTYDGGAWHFGTTTAALRCPVPLDMTLVVYVFDVEVFGSHLTAGAQSVTACAQVLELGSGYPHYTIGSCATTEPAAEPGPFVLWERMAEREDGTWLGLNEDYTLSLRLTGNGAPVPAGGGSTVSGARLHMTRQ